MEKRVILRVLLPGNSDPDVTDCGQNASCEKAYLFVFALKSLCSADTFLSDLIL